MADPCNSEQLCLLHQSTRHRRGGFKKSRFQNEAIPYFVSGTKGAEYPRICGNMKEYAGIRKNSLAQNASNHINVVRRISHDTPMRSAL